MKSESRVVFKALRFSFQALEVPARSCPIPTVCALFSPVDTANQPARCHHRSTRRRSTVATQQLPLKKAFRWKPPTLVGRAPPLQASIKNRWRVVGLGGHPVANDGRVGTAGPTDAPDWGSGGTLLFRDNVPGEFDPRCPHQQTETPFFTG